MPAPSPVTLQNILDDSSYALGEGGTPSNQTGIRTRFANDAKAAIAKIRNWSWELKSGDAINFTYTASTTKYTYTLTPSAGAIKNKNSIYWLTFTDQNSTVTYFSPVDEPTFNYNVLNGVTDNVFFLSGNDKDGYTLNVCGSSGALPTQSVTAAWNYKYYAHEADFSLTTDTTGIPSIKCLSMYVVAEVLYGYREQAQYQLARGRYQDALEDLALQDQKEAPFQPTAVQTLRQSVGFSNNFKTYYIIVLLLIGGALLFH